MTPKLSARGEVSTMRGPFGGRSAWRTAANDNNIVVSAVRRWFRMTETYHREHFFVRQNGLLHATPLFLVLVMVEFTDLVFAVDSIPAIIAITTDPFVVYTSNVFAILGLRTLYFALADIVPRFVYLNMPFPSSWWRSAAR
jgi:TerC family integral membrane protein